MRAALAALTAVRTFDLTDRFLRRRFSFCRIRLMADFVFATVPFPPFSGYMVTMVTTRRSTVPSRTLPVKGFLMTPSSDAPRKDARAGVVQGLGQIGLATLLSRLLGFVRDVVVARAFGAGVVTDAFFVAFRIPNLFRRLLAEGALSTAFVPVFTEYLATRRPEEFKRVVRSVSGAFLLLLAAMSLLGALAAPWMVRVVAPGFFDHPQQAELAVSLTRLMFPYLFFVGAAALAMGVLHAHRRFFAPALGPVALNLSMIAATLFLAPHLEVPVTGLAVGVLAGGLGQVLIQVPSLSREGVLLPPSADFSHPVLRRIAALLGPSIFGLAAVQLNVLINTLLASFLREGSVSYLYYADRVVEFPLGVFGIAVATAALPAMSEQAARKDLRQLKETFNFAFRLACFVAIPASVGLILLRIPIIRVLFERGRFEPGDTAATAWALGFYALGLIPFSVLRIVTQTFYALGDVKTPVRVGIVSLGLNVGFALAFMGPLAHGGLALASSCSSAVNFFWLFWLLRKRLGLLGGRRILASVGRICAASGLLGAWCLTLLWMWPDPASRSADAAWLAMAVGGGAVLFGAAGFALRAEEGRALLSPFARGRRTLPLTGGD